MRSRRLRGNMEWMVWTVSVFACSAAAVDYDDFPAELKSILDARIAALTADGGICVAGRVTFSNGSHISGGEDAQVNMFDGIDMPHRMYEGGWFIMTRTLSSYWADENRGFVGRAFGYDPIDEDRTVLDGQMTYLDFVLFPTEVGELASAKGIVTDEDDQPFLGANVTISFPFANLGRNAKGYSFPRMAVTTTSIGEYSFSGLSHTDHSVTATASGYAYHWGLFTPPVGGLAVQNRRLYPNRRISIEYVHQTDGSRSFVDGHLQTGIINWLNGSGGVDFSDGVVEGYDQFDLRDLELLQNQDVLEFRNFYVNGHNGFYDAGAVDFASLLEAAENGYTSNSRPCLVGHVYVVRTYEEAEYVKFLVKTDESSFRTVVPGNPDPIAFDGYGLTIDFTFSGGFSKVFVEKHFASPPVIFEDALPYYLDLSGMHGTSFVADVILTYDEADVIDRRLVEQNLTLVRSLDGGFNWFELDTVLDTHGNTLTVEGLTEFGWFAIVDLSERQPGDLDLDGDIDLYDVRRFLLCATGPESPQTDTGCVAAMLDDDVDVDLFDFDLFHGCLSGPDVLGDPACTE